MLGTAAAPFCMRLLMGIVAALLAVWLIQGGLAFRRVALTDTDDQVHLAGGLKSLRNVFITRALIIIVAIPAVCLLSIVARGSDLALQGIVP